MREGLYESLITESLSRALSTQADLEVDLAKVDPADQSHVLTRHIADAVGARLSAERDPQRRLQLANAFLESIEASSERVPEPVQELHALMRPPGPGRVLRYHQRPRTPLNDAALLTNAQGEPSLASELKAELMSADRVDLLCAFVMWHGVRLLEPGLTTIRDAGIPLRVVTTTYIGGTQRKALDRLVRDFGAEVKIQYDAARTRLHAKAWLFRRHTGFDTAYVGSSNLTTSAMLEGVEWNVRLTQSATPSLLRKFEATFDSYWSSAEFESYDPERDRDRLDDALNEAAGRRSHDRVTISISGLEVRPYPYQQEMLDRLEVERVVHDRHRNLVVAATGTGKTVVAALDYRRLVEQAGGVRPPLLFVAHRREILEQALRTYREVLADGSFGEEYVGGVRPERWEHVFASVQSLTSYGVQEIPADAFEIVVIDEFHHAEARTYRRIIDHLNPRELVGLTATPERADGVDVRAEFFGGHTAAELRLWDALGADLLCPFHYFATADTTDLRQVAWSRGRYDETELANLFTGNNARSSIVLKELRDKVADVGAMRALGFCVNVAHAEYMAGIFNEAGIPALAVTGATPAADRRRAFDQLRGRQINILFAAELFNEGLDLPDVDTVLFLRPTESATVFLQQLGRGLRRTRDKAVLTVLDFVGHHHKEFNFAQRYRALTGTTRTALIRQVEQGFPFLPSGCQIVLDRQAQELVLENIRSQVSPRWPAMVSELRSYGDLSLPAFLQESGIELAHVLAKGKRSWTELRRAAGLPTPSGSNLEPALLKRARAFAHVDDPLRHQIYTRLLASDAPDYSDLSPAEQRVARMLFFSFWSDGEDAAAGLRTLRSESAARAEIGQVIDLAFEGAAHVTKPLSGPLTSIPLRVHGRYQREEVLAALDFPRKPNSFREGVWYSRDLNIDALFVTLKKSEADYSPTTMYRDFPISRLLFHWESQSTTSVQSPTGQRYLSGASTVLLFAREEPNDELGTCPYLFLGPVTYVDHAGDRPIGITWRLEEPMPTDFFSAGSAVAQ